MSYFSSSSVVSHTFSALCVYSKFGHHPHPLGYLCAKFRFFYGLHCWARLWRQSHTQSLTHPAYLMHRGPKLSLHNFLTWVPKCQKLKIVGYTGMALNALVGAFLPQSEKCGNKRVKWMYVFRHILICPNLATNTMHSYTVHTSNTQISAALQTISTFTAHCLSCNSE